jgi:hypothetical protein
VLLAHDEVMQSNDDLPARLLWHFSVFFCFASLKQNEGGKRKESRANHKNEMATASKIQKLWR